MDKNRNPLDAGSLPSGKAASEELRGKACARQSLFQKSRRQGGLIAPVAARKFGRIEGLSYSREESGSVRGKIPPFETG